MAKPAKSVRKKFPEKVLTAVMLLYMSLVFSVLPDAIYQGSFIINTGDEEDKYHLLRVMVSILIMLLLIYQISLAKNWARHLFLLFYLISLPVDFYILSSGLSMQSMFVVLKQGLQLSGLVL